MMFDHATPAQSWRVRVGAKCLILPIPIMVGGGRVEKKMFHPITPTGSCRESQGVKHFIMPLLMPRSGSEAFDYKNMHKDIKRLQDDI